MSDSYNRYCYYCSKQYTTMNTFKRHIVNAHGLGLASILGLLSDEEEADRQRAMTENGESDHPMYTTPAALRRKATNREQALRDGLR